MSKYDGGSGLGERVILADRKRQAKHIWSMVSPLNSDKVNAAFRVVAMYLETNRNFEYPLLPKEDE